MKKIVSLSVALALSAISLTAQNVSVSASNSPADKVFAQIMQQADVNFIYESAILKNLRVSVQATNQPLSKVLDQMFRDTNISYRIAGKNVTLKASKPAKATEAPAKKITISGFVRDEKTKEALAGAAIIAGPGLGTTTNVQGFYSLTIPVGTASITVSYAGYNEVHHATNKISNNTTLHFNLLEAEDLKELVVVGSRNDAIALDLPEIGSSTLSAALIKSTPVIFGESDVVKTLQLEPGVSAGVEGFAGMYVHGGNSDENLYMLDNIPLYQVNHFAGLFSAFNTGALRNVDFYKSSFPAKYDGRLSSYMDVRTKDGSLESHHGSFTLGLTSGALNIDGPIKKGKTSYSLAVRRSWYDLLTIPACAIYNAAKKSEGDKFKFRYNFMDVNAKINHKFSDRSNAYVNFYYGEDQLHVNTVSNYEDNSYDNNSNDLRWGNILASTGWSYVFSPKLFGELTAAFTRYSSSLGSKWDYTETDSDGSTSTELEKTTTKNNINDWIARADFDWRPRHNHRVNFGANFTYHSFLPQRTEHYVEKGDITAGAVDSTGIYKATELNAYIGDDWTISDRLRVNYGVHGSLFHIDGRTHHGISPRASMRYTVNNRVSIKAGYSRTTQYIHQLTECYISLPTDQWVPITGDFKPQTADKVFAGAYWKPNADYTFSGEVYYKWMNNLIDYRDEYYLIPQIYGWDSRITSGKGTAKGVDLKLSKDVGKFTGHISYALLWADRTFAERNRGEKFPATFDNRHKINALVTWHINDKWQLNAAWTGQSGNKYTFSSQVWINNSFTTEYTYEAYREAMLNAKINNYRLPFYHRLDVSANRYTKHGYWTISLYNAYCNMNVIAITRDYDGGQPTFKYLRLIPIIPSFSYTWQF